MRFADAVAQVLADLDAGGSANERAIARGLGLAVAAWTALADLDSDGGWDLFGLDVCAAAESVQVVIAEAPVVDWSADRRSLRRSAAQLVDAIAASLEAQPAQLLLAQLQVDAAAAQLRRAGDVLR